MRRALGEVGISFQRFEAIDIERSKSHPVLARIPPMRMRPWTNGELACLLSHYEVWKLIAASSEPHGAVFEDDLHIDPRLADVINSPSALPSNAEIVKLETVNLRVSLSRREVPGPAGLAFASIKSLQTGAGAYILSRNTANLLVSSIANFDLPADDIMFGFAHALCRHLHRYQVLPALAVQDVILPPYQRTLTLASTLESDRMASQNAALAVSPSGPRRNLVSRGARKVVRTVRQHFQRRMWRELIVPFAAAGKTVVGWP